MIFIEISALIVATSALFIAIGAIRAVATVAGHITVLEDIAQAIHAMKNKIDSIEESIEGVASKRSRTLENGLIVLESINTNIQRVESTISDTDIRNKIEMESSNRTLSDIAHQLSCISDINNELKSISKYTCEMSVNSAAGRIESELGLMNTSLNILVHTVSTGTFPELDPILRARYKIQPQQA